MKISQLIGSAILSTTFIVGSQSISAGEKDKQPSKTLTEKRLQPPPKIKIALDQFDITKQEIVDELFKNFEDVKLGKSEREEISKFFNDKLQTIDRPTESFTKGCFLLLELSRNERNHHQKFIEWLNLQAEQSIRDKSKEKQKIIESAIREELRMVIKTLNHIELSKSLVIPYTKLIKENNSNADFLKNGIRVYDQFKSRGSKEINDNSIALLDNIIEGLLKLPRNEQKELKAQILLLPQNSNFQSDNEAEQNRLVERLSKALCKNKNVDTDGLIQLTDSFLYKVPYLGSTQTATKWHPYTLYKLVNDNKEYFEKNIKNITETTQDSKDEKARLKARDELLQAYITFQHIPRIKKLSDTYINIDPKLVSLENLGKLQKEVSTWYNDKLERPMFKSIVQALESESVETTTSSNGIRYAKNESWRDLNKHLEIIVRVNPELKNEFRDVLIKRLENDKSPQNREMVYETIKNILYNQAFIEHPPLMNLIKKGIAEESSNGAYLIGELLPSGWRPHSFVNAFENYDVIKELDPKEVSAIDAIKFDLIRTVSGDTDLYKIYLPRHSFEPTKDKTIDPKTLSAILQLRENAYIALSSINLHSLEARAHDKRIDYLERRIERVGTIQTLTPTWGKQAASLTMLYLQYSDTVLPESEGKIYFESKLDFLRGKFFDGITKTYEIEGEKKKYTTIPFFNAVLESEFIRLNPDENRKIIDQLYRQKATNAEIRDQIFRQESKLQRRYIEMKQTFALNFLTLLCERDHTKFNEYLPYLQRLGYRNDEIREVVAMFLETKD